MKYLLSFLITFFLFDLHARIIEGRVTAFGEIGLKNVEVKAKSGAKTFTDTNGEFSIEVAKKDVLTFKASGFYTRKIKGELLPFLDVNLLFRDGESEKGRSLANPHISKKDLEQGISSSRGINYRYYEMSSIYELLRFEHPSIRVDESGRGANVYLENRGVNSFNLSTAALLIVDGMIVDDISTIQPTEVERVSILQGSDAARWGVQGSNGVIVIDLLSGEN